ncbi:hypothetical protein FQN49_007990 [Arthroderma sp. PD_2]|nr:hypothetical protein FQN49_007990 [Arthroderma sp. PD_2]
MLLPILTFLLPLAAWGADTDLPGVIEFDLVFPRNETYAPTQYFPLVLAARNSRATWPLGMTLTMHIWPAGEEAPTETFLFPHPPQGHTSGLPLSDPYFAIAGTNVTNGRAGEFTVIWSATLRETCKESHPLKDPGKRPFHTR